MHLQQRQNHDIIGIPGWAPIFGTRRHLLVAQLCKETHLYALAHLSCRSMTILDRPSGYPLKWLRLRVVDAPLAVLFSFKLFNTDLERCPRWHPYPECSTRFVLLPPNLNTDYARQIQRNEGGARQVGSTSVTPGSDRQCRSGRPGHQSYYGVVVSIASHHHRCWRSAPMGEVQPTSPYLHRPRQTVPWTPCLGRGPVKRLFPVNTGNQLVSDSAKPHRMPYLLW